MRKFFVIYEIENGVKRHIHDFNWVMSAVNYIQERHDLHEGKLVIYEEFK